jgi:surface polysaccharide O-acyltransferase-like enzyme
MAQSRLFGIELFRAIAAFAVVVVHAAGFIQYSDQLPIHADRWLLVVTQVCRFAVPFFLAASFYFVVGKLLSAPEQFETKKFLWSRTVRLLLPYGIWSLIYLSVRMLKSLNSPEGVTLLFQDPIFLIFLGGSAIHLYFLPLLYTGSFFVPLLKGNFAKLNLKWYVLLLLSACALYELLFVTGNSFELGINCLQQPQGCSVALESLFRSSGLSGLKNPLTRLLSVEFVWTIRCSMLILTSVVLYHRSLQHWLARQGWQTGCGIFLLATLGGLLEHFKVSYFPLSLYELGVGYGPLLWGIALSRSKVSSLLILQFGKVSFGIYLVHYLILICIFSAVVKLPTVLLQFCPPLVLALLVSVVTYVISEAVTFQLSRQHAFRRLLSS